MNEPVSRPIAGPVQPALGEDRALSLPPRRPEPDALRKIRAYNTSTRRWMVILDDDPTGCQAMYDATVLIEPATDDLARAARERRATFVWTNTRGLPEAQAADVNRALVRSAIEAAPLAGARPVFISRSDSTLRGHFAAEVSAVAGTCRAAGRPVDGVVFAPAFLEAGRVTADDIQWVIRADGQAVPSAHTEFANDATFGYREVNLRDWVAARTSMPPEKITSIPLDALRAPGTAAPEKILLSLRDGTSSSLTAPPPPTWRSWCWLARAPSGPGVISSIAPVRPWCASWPASHPKPPSPHPAWPARVSTQAPGTASRSSVRTPRSPPASSTRRRGSTR